MESNILSLNDQTYNRLMRYYFDIRTNFEGSHHYYNLKDPVDFLVSKINPFPNQHTGLLQQGKFWKAEDLVKLNILLAKLEFKYKKLKNKI